MLALAAFAPAQEGPQQPLPYSHKVHAGDLKLACKMCHVNPDPGELMTLPATSTCMKCHSAVKTESPHIQKLAAAAKEGKDIKWVRVYRIPGYVFFSHKAHVDAGATCQECHGEVATRDQLFKERPNNMGACMECHRQKKASIDCAFCHEQR